MSSLIKILFSVTGPPVLSEFEAACKQPQIEQEKLLMNYMKHNEATAFGRDHGFAEIRSFAHFQKVVPIGTYESIKPYIARELEGEHRQLTAESPVLFTTTSGTTGDPKYIPVTPKGKIAKSKQMRVWLSGLFRDYPSITDHKVLTLVSPEVEMYAPCGTPCGAESGHGYRSMPKAIKAMYCCPYEVYEIKDYDARYYAILRITAGHTLGMMYHCMKLSEQISGELPHVVLATDEVTFVYLKIRFINKLLQRLYWFIGSLGGHIMLNRNEANSSCDFRNNNPIGDDLQPTTR